MNWSILKRLLSQTADVKPPDLQSLEEARVRLHKTVKASTADIRKEVDAFTQMVRDMHAPRPPQVQVPRAPAAGSRQITKKTATRRKTKP